MVLCHSLVDGSRFRGKSKLVPQPGLVIDGSRFRGKAELVPQPDLVVSRGQQYSSDPNRSSH